MRFCDLTREQLRELVATAVVVLPVGACEQHGPHLPVGTDFLLAERIAVVAAERIEEFPVLVAPTIAAGSSEHHVPFGGTISVSSETLQRYLAECCDSLVRSGFRRLFLLNAHGGNIDVIGDVARDVSTRAGVPVASGSYWTIAWDALVALGAHERGLVPGHAGAFETALAKAGLPAAAAAGQPHRPSTRTSDPRSFYPPYRIDDPAVWARNDGYTDDPAKADPGDGARYLEAVINAVTAAILDFRSKGA